MEVICAGYNYIGQMNVTLYHSYYQYEYEFDLTYTPPVAKRVGERLIHGEPWASSFGGRRHTKSLKEEINAIIHYNSVRNMKYSVKDICVKYVKNGDWVVRMKPVFAEMMQRFLIEVQLDGCSL